MSHCLAEGDMSVMLYAIQNPLDASEVSIMRSVIQQSVVLPARAEALYRMYLDPAVHAAITCAEVAIGSERGAEFKAFEGMLTGTIREVVEPRLIVQSWRSAHFTDDDPDSTLILAFSPEGTEARIDLVHLDVPEHDYQPVVEGWEKFYWTPWRAYLAEQASGD